LTSNVEIEATDTERLVAFAHDHSIKLTVIGPEVPLALGVADAFDEAALPVYGPTRAAARLEWSKAWARQFMHRHAIPQPKFEVLRDVAQARAYATRAAPCVVKADGLAAGKGAIVCASPEEARAAIDLMLAERRFGAAGDTVLVEELVRGRELSYIVLSDGQVAVPLVPAQDYKRAEDQDRGPNTGGMGSYAPAQSVQPELLDAIHNDIINRAFDGMRAEGSPYRGTLYAGLILDHDGPKVIEFNCRFGDPETQAQLPLLDSDLYLALEACTRGRLRSELVRWKGGACVCVVLASQGYPGTYRTGYRVRGLELLGDRQDVYAFHAGTRIDGEHVVTSGGRVLGITATADDLKAATAQAYQVIGPEGVWFENSHFRSDIGAQA
jgi:phosphoribosylamine--glycine ligase